MLSQTMQLVLRLIAMILVLRNIQVTLQKVSIFRLFTSMLMIRKLVLLLLILRFNIACCSKDFLIDLIGYRRYGHNEMDDPAVTQPQVYKRLKITQR